MIVQLPLENVYHWKGVLPQQISARCAKCGQVSFFTTANWAEHGPVRYSWGGCPICHQLGFFAIDNFADQKQKLGGGGLYFSPANPAWQILPDLLAALAVNPEMQKDYVRGVGYFNTGDPQGTVSAARRLLEGLVVQFIPKEKRESALARNLPKLNEHHDLSGVLRKMSEAIKDAGNLGVHFGASRLTQEIAALGWSMVDELVRMHLMLEQRVGHLRALVDAARASNIEGVAASMSAGEVAPHDDAAS